MMATPTTTVPATAVESRRSQQPSSHAPLAAQPPLATNSPPSSPPVSAYTTPSTPPSVTRAAEHALRHARIEMPPRPNYATTRRRRASESTVSTLHQPSRTASLAFAAADKNAKRNIPQLSEQHKHELGYTIVSQLYHRWLPSLFSPQPIRHTFPRNLDNAVRALIAFIVAAVIAVQPWALSLLAVPYLFLVFAVITVRSTVGMTIQLIDQQLKGVLAAVAIDMIVTGAQIRNLSQTNRVIVAEIVLFFTSIGLAYYFHPPLARRFSLAIHALIMIEIAQGVDQVILPLQILLCVVLAYGVSLLLVLLPFPRLARDELLDRYQLALLSLSNVFDEVVQCYLSTEPIAPQVLHTKVTSQLESVFKSLTVMRRLQGEMRLESQLFSLLSPVSMSVGNPVIADPDRIEQLYWIDVNLLETLSTLHYSSYHAAFVHYLRDALHQLSRAQCKFLELFGRADSCVVSKARLDESRKRLDEAMTEAWDAYNRGRHALYGYGASMDSHSADNVRAAAERRKRRHSIGQGQAMDGHQHKPLTDTAAAGSDWPQETLRMQVKGEFQADSQLHMSTPEPQPVLYHSTTDVFKRSSFFFYIARFHHALNLLPLDEDVLAVDPIIKKQPATFTSTASSQPPSTFSSTTRDDFQPSSWPRKRFALTRLVREHVHHPLSWSLLGLHPVNDFLYLFTAFAAFVRRPTVDWGWLRSSIKISLIVCVASLIAVIPQIGATTICQRYQHQPHALSHSVCGGCVTHTVIVPCTLCVYLCVRLPVPNASWAAFTAAILTSDSEGALWQVRTNTIHTRLAARIDRLNSGSHTSHSLHCDVLAVGWQRGFHRLFGTLLGGLIGYLIIYAFPDQCASRAVHTAQPVSPWPCLFGLS